jgi:shikimate dehydrogenase
MRRFGLIGYPLSHSFSAGFFEKKFNDEHIEDALYQNFPLESIDLLSDLLSKYRDLQGLNVTIPYKRDVMRFLFSLDETAQKVGAVNTIKIIREKGHVTLKGYNTDVYGFEESITPYLKPTQKKAFILGSGGASKAVVFVLEKLKIKADIISRDSGKGIFKTYAQVTADDMKTHQIIVNTTPLGMYPSTGQSPALPYNEISSEHLLFDLIYNPLETQFLAEGKKRGAITINGLEMLHLQALKAWEIWNL